MFAEILKYESDKHWEDTKDISKTDGRIKDQSFDCRSHRDRKEKEQI